jgi:hypothetical protein
MERKVIEALSEAIIRTSGYWNADNPIYDARNPGGLLAFSPTQTRDANGYRVFASALDGMQALIYDVQLKLSGKSRARLSPDSTLADFAAACGLPTTAAVNWSAFLRKALHDANINPKTPIAHFLKDLGEKQ